MSACIVKAHNAGLFSLINNVITCLCLYEKVQVKWTDSIYRTDGNLWDKLFKSMPELDEEPDIITQYPIKWLTYKNAGYLYGLDQWRWSCNVAWVKHVTVRGEITNRVDRWVAAFEKYTKVIAVLVRAHTHAGEQLTNRSQSLDEYARAIESELELRDGARSVVYVAAGDDETLEWFKARFPILYHPYTKRSSSRDIDRHLVVPQTWQDAVTCLEEVLIMSHAQSFVHPVSNMATAVLYINPNIKSAFLL